MDAIFRRFAEVDCTQDPLYVAICRAVADAPELLALMAHAPPTQRKPNLLLAALHERVLAGAAHPLCDYYPSVGGSRLPDAELPALLLDFARSEQAALVDHLRHASTQTNETGRCAVLWPALQHIAAVSGRQDLALLDFGCSAGLNLAVDLYRYDYGMFQRGPVGSALTIPCRWLGDASPPTDTAWRLRSRLGLDPAPIDLRDEAAVRWLRACLWPHDRERAARLDAAVALAGGFEIRQAEDCMAQIEPWLDGLPPEVQPVLFNSWVLYYFDAPLLARFRAIVERLVRERGLAWLSAEAPGTRPPGLALPPLADGAEPSTLWTLQIPGRETEALAWSHPHGRWLQWTAAAAR
ncbi:DUF2332 domain-containing protein [Pelomonas sp. KK5]|uniref:DUF2332 domain-containing protein n=1 Tax=Pelomonas sp. KK5 TaxID=1855730 RepID=UPI00097C89CD|nr:DUF2332 domain-containing protein [Pelomonas sp. KK5]